jgi:membrane protein implicated in regulation of membrane protease activity
MALVLAVLLAILVVPDPWGWLLVAAGVIFEVAEGAFWFRLTRRWRVKAGPETLIGASGDVVLPCLPEGQVRVGGEIWAARCTAGARTGEHVRVVGRDGLVLVVEPETRPFEPE